jgi:hypothetical protein
LLASLSGEFFYRFRMLLLGATLAFLISPNSVLLLIFGLLGIPGSSLLTGALLVIATTAIGLLCFRTRIIPLPADYIFLALIFCIAASCFSNGWTSNAKEYELLALSLAAYLACRFVSYSDLASSTSSFVLAATIIVTLGTIVTASALAEQWNGDHGKPIVFGQDAAGTHFFGLLGFLIIALVTTGRLTVRQTILVSVLIFFPCALFAASFVRFTFIALAGSLGCAIILSEAKQRKFIIAVGLVILAASVTGLASRYNMAVISVKTAMEDTVGDVGPEKPPSCYLKVNPRNSFAIRKALLRDALFLTPRAGWFGIGLDSFFRFSCMKLTQVHNSILQTVVEFGWLAGGLLCLLILTVVVSIWSLARQDGTSRFVLCSLLFGVILSMAHGRISRDVALFVFLGCAVGLRETAQAVARPQLVG